MSILIFNKLSHFDAPYEHWLQDLDEELILLTSDKWEKGFNTGYAQIYSFENYDFNNSVELTAVEVFEKSPYHKVIVTAERDILRAAKLREYLGIEGQSWESASAFRDKVKMKSILQEAQIRVPAFSAVDSVYDLYDFIKKQGYPVVVKPVDGMGSRDTTILSNRDDLKQFLIEGLTPNLEVEQFIEGEMYHIDGLVLHGKLVHIWPSKYLNDCLAFHEGKYLGSYLLEPANPLTNRLIDFVTSVLQTLPTPDHTSFHAEVFHTPQDELVLCEVACRTGGSRICEEFRQAFDLDLNKLPVQAQCGLPIAPISDGQTPKAQFGFIGLPPKQGVFHSAPQADELPEWVTEYVLLTEPGETFSGAHTSVDYVLTLVITGDSEGQVYQRIQEIADYFEQKMVWSK